MKANLRCKEQAVIRSLIRSTALFLILITWGSFPQQVFTQTSPLNRHITIHVNHERLSEVILLIGSTGKFTFSYNSDILPGDSLVSISIEEERVKRILDMLLSEKNQYKVLGNQFHVPSILINASRLHLRPLRISRERPSLTGDKSAQSLQTQ